MCYQQVYGSLIEWEQAKVWEPPQDEQDKASKDKTRGGNAKGNGKDANKKKDSPRGKARSSGKKDPVKGGSKEVGQEDKDLAAKEKSKDDKNGAAVAKKKKKKKIVCPFLSYFRN